MNHSFVNKVYIAPVAEVNDICTGSVFCASGSTQKYDVNDYSDGWSDNS